ncbi:hypothetical protein N7488_004481 [Penicillium malachiteum]|nr:hypothetical protein N7488_004481 [Penicillium malachiteum]
MSSPTITAGPDAALVATVLNRQNESPVTCGYVMGDAIHSPSIPIAIPGIGSTLLFSLVMVVQHLPSLNLSILKPRIHHIQHLT